LFTVIFDHRPAYLQRGGHALSLLGMPFGARPYLAHLLTQVHALDVQSDRDIVVVPTFESGDDYHRQIESISSGEARSCAPDKLPQLLSECEVGDFLLLINSLRWPKGGLKASSFANGDYLAATHLVSLGIEAEWVRERVQQNDRGMVTSVQRQYDGVVWPQVANTRICASFVPAWAACETSFTNLAELRAALCAKGVLSRDLPLPVGDIDLSQPDGLLAINETLAAYDVANPDATRLQLVGRSLLAGRHCEIAPTARIVGPVILQDNVRIADDATIVGPSVIGAGSTIETGAVIAQSLLAPHAHVTPGSTVHHRVAVGSQNGQIASIDCPSIVAESPLRSVVGDGYLRHVREVSPINPPRRTRQWHLIAKRAVDLAVSSISLLVLSPLFAVLSIWIKLDSPGRVFFIHRREGKGGREFACLKFRTMTADAHKRQRELYELNEVDGPQFKLDNDPRVTRLGRWLRGTNLDELPQLINVLIGDMSLVGPRPSPFRENQVCVPWRRARLSVRPGITGLWQMCRAEDRSEGDFHEWIFYDIAYVRHLSFWMDLKILFATVLTGGGRRSVSVSWFVPREDGPGTDELTPEV